MTTHWCIDNQIFQETMNWSHASRAILVGISIIYVAFWVVVWLHYNYGTITDYKKNQPMHWHKAPFRFGTTKWYLIRFYILDKMVWPVIGSAATLIIFQTIDPLVADPAQHFPRFAAFYLGALSANVALGIYTYTRYQDHRDRMCDRRKGHIKFAHDLATVSNKPGVTRGTPNTDNIQMRSIIDETANKLRKSSYIPTDDGGDKTMHKISARGMQLHKQLVDMRDLVPTAGGGSRKFSFSGTEIADITKDMADAHNWFNKHKSAAEFDAADLSHYSTAFWADPSSFEKPQD